LWRQQTALELFWRLLRYPLMRDQETLYLLESRVREVERLAADCVLQGEDHRRQRIIVQYCKAAKIPKKKTRNFSWPALSRHSTSYGWPPV
jgi:hypothetical protein